MLDLEQMSLRLRSEGYTPGAIRAFQEDALTLKSPLLEAAQHWVQSGQIPDVQIDGVTLQQVMQNHHNHVLAALSEMQVLQRETLSEEERQYWVQYLNSPLSFE